LPISLATWAQGTEVGQDPPSRRKLKFSPSCCRAKVYLILQLYHRGVVSEHVVADLRRRGAGVSAWSPGCGILACHIRRRAAPHKKEPGGSPRLLTSPRACPWWAA